MRPVPLTPFVTIQPTGLPFCTGNIREVKRGVALRRGNTVRHPIPLFRGVAQRRRDVVSPAGREHDNLHAVALVQALYDCNVLPAVGNEQCFTTATRGL